MKTKKTTRWLIVSTALMIAVALIVVGACAQPTPIPTPPAIEPMTITWDGLWASPEETMGKTILWFQEQIGQKTDGKIKFNNVWSFGMSQMGEELDAAATGVTQFSGVVPGYYPTRLQLNNITMSIPFSETDVHKFLSVMESLYYEDNILSGEYEKQGVKFLFSELTPSYQLLSREPITKLEDFSGKKIAITSTIAGRMLEAIGAVPVPSGLMDRPVGLQTGLLDGSILMTDLHYVIGAHEFAKYSMSSDFGCWANGHEVVNLELFNSLPKELQDIIEETTREANRYYVEELIGAYQWAEGGMKEDGVTFNPPLSFEEKVEWANAASQVVAEWIREGEGRGLPAKELVEKYMTLMKAGGWEFPREWALE
ncbi:MAG: TRAP transporter substrate-binding protein DctP [Candidatus Thorarchaeota archaeon]|jgi:TRAP-type C4-dicarboxylate transport system substrate-binding protein